MGPLPPGAPVARGHGEVLHYHPQEAAAVAAGGFCGSRGGEAAATATASSALLAAPAAGTAAARPMGRKREDDETAVWEVAHGAVGRVRRAFSGLLEHGHEAGLDLGMRQTVRVQVGHGGALRVGGGPPSAGLCGGEGGAR